MHLYLNRGVSVFCVSKNKQTEGTLQKTHLSLGGEGDPYNGLHGEALLKRSVNFSQKM